MKLFYDYQIFAMQKYGGISRYFFELIRQLDETGTDELRLGMIETRNEYWLQAPQLFNQIRAELGFCDKLSILSGRAGHSRVNKAKSVQSLKKGAFDLCHPTYYDPYFLDHIENRPFVLTIHDMIHEIFPEFLPLTDRVRENKKDLAKRANRIITVSENTRLDIAEYYNIDEERIEVVYHGSSIENFLSTVDSPNNRLDLPARYLLFVGNRALYKNFYFLAVAAAKIIQEDPELKLVCAGGGAFSPEEAAFLRSLQIAAQVVYYPVTRQNLAQLYQNAQAFIFPSLYEGFGIPVLEAFNCGCPVILSNTSSLPEVAGNAAEYFDPKSISSLRAAVNKVIYDNDLQEHLRCKGYERAVDFSWTKTAAQTRKVYEKAL
jgi:glycosyltransferase involved in cell wall biosynthesis